MIFTPNTNSIIEVQAYIDEILETLEVPMKIAAKIGIVVDEIYSNIVFYSGASEADVTCTITDQDILLTFTDNGTPYDPFAAVDPDTTLPAEDRTTGGLGVFITKKIMDSYSYHRENNQNITTLKAKL